MNDDLFDSIVELNESEVLKIVNERIQSGENVMDILDTSRKAMIEIGDRFAKKEYFLSELVMAGEIFREIMEILEPELIGSSGVKSIGKILVGTVKGDIHDLGKNIAISILKGNGFEVKDLGVDVTPEVFVEKIKEFEPEILGLSCVISIGWDALKETVDALKEAGLRDKVKIILGGGGVSKDVLEYAGADAAVNDAIEGLEQCKRWISA
jgi:5-methyltetrahydrofolate--homocysteine methyltransferase